MIFGITARGRIISVLGVVQIFTWGSTYYLPAILTDPILSDTGWSRTSVTAGVSLALLTSALVATHVGRAIQAFGGRPVLSLGVLLIALGLIMAGLAAQIEAFLIAWVVIGAGMGAALYDAAFSTLGRLYGADARRAITALTLWGGFASTLCWPISAWLVHSFGWRGTCFAYALFHGLVSLPLCWTLPKERRSVVQPGIKTEEQPSTILRNSGFWLLVVSGTLLSFVAAVWSMLLVSLLHMRGIETAAAVGLGMLIGPSQVAGRLADLAFVVSRHPIWTMLAATGLVALGFLGLRIGVPAAAALVAYGAGNGLWSNARGAMPLALFGARDYPRIMGNLATPNLLAAAVAPSIGAALLEHFGPDGTLTVLFSLSFPPALCALILLWHVKRPRDLSG